MAWGFQRVVPTSLVPGLTSITSVAWDHGSPQPRFATGSRDGTIFVWTPSFQPGGTTPARKAPRIKWQSLQPVPAPLTREILSSPTEGESAMVNPDIEFGSLQFGEWAPETLESGLMFDSPEALPFWRTISMGNHHRPSLEVSPKVILTMPCCTEMHDMTRFPPFSNPLVLTTTLLIVWEI